ncbi:aldo/keto reductase [uncultured Algibacter sp.]|uniref:aldo/keto reductase n=1 Tax=uncultured Algibacter sp. TaxID=298659 RepID=UPI0026196479|nr:aldo/keto reductase [uncultured Algibacter sp.]
MIDNYKRREVLELIGLSGLGLFLMPLISSINLKREILKRKIPSGNEFLASIGLGTWQTFDVGNAKLDRDILTEVLSKMYDLGGTVIDSSPMYGTSESVVGDLTNSFKYQNNYFYATKVWTSGKEAGIEQMRNSFKAMKRNQIDLMQIHNLVDWKTHVKTLKDWKEKGNIKYWGITHYLDSSHSQLEKIIKSEKPDFVQFNYSIRSRHAEKSLFNVAKNNNTAVLVNRPFESGRLFGITKGKELPDWAKECDINSWGQFFLKFILSNELVTCVIPGTSKPHHMIDNMMAGYGEIPDSKMREKMYDYIKTL